MCPVEGVCLDEVKVFILAVLEGVPYCEGIYAVESAFLVGVADFASTISKLLETLSGRDKSN